VADQEARTPSTKRLHIVLVPGFAGFDALGQLEYYGGITPLLLTNRNRNTSWITGTRSVWEQTLASPESSHQNGLVKKLLWLIMSVAVFTLLYLGVALVRRKPVLFHIMAETGCACGDYHEEVTGLVIFNPLRDRLRESRR
jgi:hypothetical protein